MKESKSIFNLLLFALSFAFIANLSGCNSMGSKEAPANQPTGESWLFAQTADSGTVKHNESDGSYTVTLNGAAPVMIKFTDTPVRKASTIKAEDFVENWSKMFPSGKPNAAIVALIEAPPGHIEEAAVCTITNVAYDKKTDIMTYTVKGIPGEKAFIIDKKGKPIHKLATEFGPIIMFIDSAQISGNFNLVIKNQTGDDELYIQTDRPATSKGIDLNNNPTVITQLEAGKEPNTYLIDVPIPTSSLRVYVFNEIPNPTQDEYAPNDPVMKNIRYDYFELTVDGTDYSCGDLSSLDQLGRCIELQSSKNGKLVETMGWKQPLTTVVGQIKTINPSAVKGEIDKDPVRSTFVRVLGPTLGVEDWENTPNWVDAFQALQGQKITITGKFNGVANPKKKGQWLFPPAKYDYVGTYDSGVWTFTGQDDNHIPNEKLIFKNITQKDIFGGDFDFTIIAPDGKTTTHKSANDVYECVLRDFATGFNHGFFGKFNSSKDFSVKNQWASQYYNVYSKTIEENSNSYGDAYSDNVGMNVHIGLSPKTVDTLTAILLADNQSGGYNKKAAEGGGGSVQSKFMIGFGNPGKYPINTLIINGDEQDKDPSNNFWIPDDIVKDKWIKIAVKAPLISGAQDIDPWFWVKIPKGTPSEELQPSFSATGFLPGFVWNWVDTDGGRWVLATPPISKMVGKCDPNPPAN
ncbi:MAG TPA: hypothetical protein DD381_05650 [Lentisphaeria bacterium]|nr:MAG: hypothetical protein A2X47_08450 [Lentisphaerae bacterium GWF2_38_69]HBM15811.1 hypothetical protein [Lentisphaeria bacterium]